MAPTASPEPSIDLKSAVEAALRHCKALFNDVSTTNFMLEEVDYDEAEAVWLITIGFDVQRQIQLSALMEAIRGPNTTAERIYKTVKVDGKTGKLLAVKIRKLD